MSGVGNVADRLFCLFVRYSFIRVDEISGNQSGPVKVRRNNVGCVRESEGSCYVRVVPNGKGETAALLDLTDALL